MNDQSDGVLNAIYEAASNPKAGIAVGAGSAGASAAVTQGLITGWLADLTTTLGILATALVIAVQAVKFLREIVGLRKDLKSEEKE